MTTQGEVTDFSLSGAGPQSAPSLQSKQFTIPLSLSPHTTLHIKLTRLETSNLILLTTTDPSTSSSLSALGSFIYAMPNRLDPSNSLSTALCSVSNTVDFATRVAKIIARKTGKPAYVGCSVSFAGAMVEEEIEGVRMAIDTVMNELERVDDPPKTNGV